MPSLDDAILLAVTAHHGQEDKVGQPYCLHVLRVMFRMHTEEERIVAVLHDLVEDTAHKLDDLRALGYSQSIVQAIDALTRRPHESYEQFVARAAANPLARPVKIADIEDNMDLRRLPAIGDRDIERLRRYMHAWHLLTGDPTP